MYRLTFSLALPLLLVLHLNACVDTRQDASSVARTAVSVSAPPITGNSPELLVDSEVSVRIASPLSTAGAANYSRSGSMVLGGPQASSVIYEIGRLRAGDKLSKLELMLGEGRVADEGCLVRCAMSGDAQWQEFEMKPASSLQQLETADLGLIANPDASLFVMISTAANEGIAITDLRAEFDLSSGTAVAIHLRLPESDVMNVDIRIPMLAVDADGRRSDTYGGIADLRVDTVHGAMHVPVAFVKGYADAIFRMTQGGDFAIEFTSDLQQPVTGTLHIYETELPVYAIEVQQVHPGVFDTTDLSVLPTYATMMREGFTPAPVTITANPLLRADSPKQPMTIEFDSAWQDPQYGYQRQRMELKAAEFDPSQLRDLLATWIFAECDLPVLHLRPVHLRLNGCYQGVFIEAELPDQAWMDANGMADDDELYVLLGHGGLNANENIGYFEDLFSRVRQPDGGMKALQDMLDEMREIFTRVEDVERLNEITGLLDYRSLYNYLAAQSMTSTTDNWRSHYAVWQQDGDVDKWCMLPMDVSLAFGMTEGSNPVLDGSGFASLNEIDMVGGIADNIVLRTLLSNSESQQLLHDRMYGLMDTSLTEDRVIEKLNELHAFTETDIQSDPFALVPNGDYEAQLELIRENIREHWQFLRDQVVKPGSESDSHEDHAH